MNSKFIYTVRRHEKFTLISKQRRFKHILAEVSHEISRETLQLKFVSSNELSLENWLLRLRSEKSLRNKVPDTGALSLQITTTPKIGYTYLHTKALQVSGPLSELVSLLGVITTTLATMAPLEISLLTAIPTMACCHQEEWPSRNRGRGLPIKLAKSDKHVGRSSLRHRKPVNFDFQNVLV